MSVLQEPERDTGTESIAGAITAEKAVKKQEGKQEAMKENTAKTAKDYITRERMLALIGEILQVPEGTINEATRMEDVEEWDSLAHVMLIGELEERLGISIPLEQAAEIASVAELFKAAGLE